MLSSRRCGKTAPSGGTVSQPLSDPPQAGKCISLTTPTLDYVPIVGPIMLGVELWRQGKLGESLKELNARYMLAKEKSENEIDQIVSTDREFSPHSHLGGHVKHCRH